MLGKAIISLAVCCLPVMADSIVATGYSNWVHIDPDHAEGMTDLTYLGHASEPDGSTASLSQARVSETGDAITGNIDGSLLVTVGNPYSWHPDPITGVTLSITRNLDSASGNYLLTGTDVEQSTNGETNHPACFLLISGGTYNGDGCSAPNFSTTIFHGAGDPLTLTLSYQHGVQGYDNLYSENFNLVLTDLQPPPSGAPEPGTFGLMALPVLGFFGYRNWSAKRT